jgi:hypothetical protein
MSIRFWLKNRVWQEWYQSRVDHRNASLVIRVVFWRLFYNKKKLILLPPSSKPLVCYLSCLLSCSSWPLCYGKRFYQLFPNLPNFFWHLHVDVFISKHLNEVWRYNEGHAKDEVLLSSRIEDTFGWRDGRVAPASPPRKMTIHAPPVYVIPRNDSD